MPAGHVGQSGDTAGRVDGLRGGRRTQGRGLSSGPPRPASRRLCRHDGASATLLRGLRGLLGLPARRG